MFFRCSNCVESMNDFCYLCYQHARRNVQVDLTKQREKDERDKDRLLQLYTTLRDAESVQKEKVCSFKFFPPHEITWGFPRKLQLLCWIF